MHHLNQHPSGIRVPKIIKIGQCSTKYWAAAEEVVYLETQCRENFAFFNRNRRLS